MCDGTIRPNLQLADDPANEAELWAGERRRLSVAQGLLRNPDIPLLDEPTEGLDTATAVRLLAGVRELLPRTVPVRRPPRPSITRCAVARRCSDRALLAAQSSERRRSVGWLRR
jgi:ABC-type phosphonate transport system ATPase subunit